MKPLFAILLLATGALAAPTFQGGPEYSTRFPGTAVGDFRSRWAIKADVDGTRADRLAALAFFDARGGTMPGEPAAFPKNIGTFSLAFSQAGVPRFATGRKITFRPWGWEETVEDGTLRATADVFTLDRDTFAVVLDVGGVDAPLEITAQLEGEAVQSNYTADAIGIDTGEQRPFSLSYGVNLEGATRSGSGGTTFQSSLTSTLVVSGRVAFVLAFDPNATQAKARLDAAWSQKGGAAAWGEAIRTDWNAYLTSFRATLETAPGRLETDLRARAVLRMNGPGVSAKSYDGRVRLWDAAFQALGASERSPAEGFQVLESLSRAQLAGAGEPDVGMIPNHVDAEGAVPKLAIPGATDVFSQSPSLALVIRELYERSPPDDASRASLQSAYERGSQFLGWWARRRDQDLDGLAEANGGWEAGQENSPLVTELWGGNGQAKLPVGEADPRARLDAVDLNSWLFLYEVELSRIARLLGRDSEVRSWQEKLNDRAVRINDDANGFWNQDRGGYFDFTRVGEAKERRFLGSRTFTLWSPLFAGATRDSARVRRLVTEITDPKQFWGTYGVPSVAFDDAAFDAANRWRGPVWLSANYLTVLALYRYGYEAKADELRQKLLDTVAADGELWEYYDAKTGKGLGARGVGTTAALALELARRRYESETFALQEGGPARTRQGYWRRLFRLSDGRLLAEVSVEGSVELPHTQIEAETQIFSDEPMTFRFTDPTGILAGRQVTLTLPELSEATVEVGDQPAQSFRAGADLVTVKAGVGETLRVSRFRFKGQGGCGCSSAGASASWLVLLSFLSWIGLSRRGGGPHPERAPGFLGLQGPGGKGRAQTRCCPPEAEALPPQIKVSMATDASLCIVRRPVS